MIETGNKYSCAFCVIGRGNLTNRPDSLCSSDNKLDKVLSLTTLIAEARAGNNDKIVVEDDTTIVFSTPPPPAKKKKKRKQMSPPPTLVAERSKCY